MPPRKRSARDRHLRLPHRRAEPRIARQNARWAASDRWLNGWRSFVLIFGGAFVLIAGIALTEWLTGPA
ncbi:hypothetical protein ACR3S4_14165 [Streptomyces sp. CH8.1]|uniref:hypothetical protein n=1 Tax=Streptomyces sp. CH8.1 TaxID=3439546 RepID=UPI003DA04A25